MKKFLLLFLLLFFFFPKASFAEVIHNFDVSVTAHKNGVMDIKESIDYDFESIDRHGIFRTIPLYAKVGDLYRISKFTNIKVLRDGNLENFNQTEGNEELSLKIGNADKTINGNHKYEILYTVENGVGSNFSGHDEIYWNATGNDWQITIEKASIQITTDFGINPTNIICFEGPFGSKDKTCQINGNLISSGQTYYPGFGLSEVAVYPVGTFPKSILSKTPPQTLGEKAWNSFLRNFNYIWSFLNIILVLVLIYWYQKHKNKKRFGEPAVNFDIPMDGKQRIAPALAGTTDTAKLERDDITATIFDLAIRKYIKLSEEKTVKKFSPDINTQLITKLKEPDKNLEPYEKTLMDRFFRDADAINVSDLKLDFYETFSTMETQVFSLLVAKGYYTKNPKNQKAFLIVLSVFALFTSNVILAAVLFFLSQRLNGRTAKGDEIDFKIDGLKLFLKSMDRNYKWQAQKFYTVEQMIPYAMALGYIDKFMEALKILKPDYNPNWYSGGSGSFYASYALFSSAAISNFTTSAPSSSSGSGGGGFSGGGGGGGGGGSW